MNNSATPEVDRFSDVIPTPATALSSQAAPQQPSAAQPETPRLRHSAHPRARKTSEAWEKIPRRARDLLHELTGDQVKLWLAYRLGQFGQDKNCYPSSERLSGQTGLSLHAVSSNRQVLFAKGWLWFMGFHRRADGTFSGRTLECRAVVPESSEVSRVIKAPPAHRQRTDRREVTRGKNGRFMRKAVGTDNGPGLSSDGSPITVFPPSADDGFATVTDNVAEPSENRPFDKDILQNKTSTVQSSSSLSRSEDEDDAGQQAVVVLSKEEPSITDTQVSANRSSIDSLTTGKLTPQSGYRATTTRSRKKRRLTDKEVLADLEDHFRSVTGICTRFRCPSGLPFITEKATHWHREFMLQKAREKGMGRIHAIIELFACDRNHDLKKIDCPIAFLKSRWDDYEAEADAMWNEKQDPNRWQDAVDFLEGYGEWHMSNSQKEQVRHLCEGYGTGDIEDAYGEYPDHEPSGLDAFLADPAPYMEAADA